MYGDLVQGEILYYPFDYDQAYLVPDQSGNGNDGKAYPRFHWTDDGVLPGAGVFVAEQDLACLTNATAIECNFRTNALTVAGTGPISVSAWVYLDSLPPFSFGPIRDNSLIFICSNLQLSVTSEGVLQLWLENIFDPKHTDPPRTPVAQYGGFTTGLWHYVTATYDAPTSNACLYLDGSLVATGSGSRASSQPLNKILQGRCEYRRRALGYLRTGGAMAVVRHDGRLQGLRPGHLVERGRAALPDHIGQPGAFDHGNVAPGRNRDTYTTVTGGPGGDGPAGSRMKAAGCSPMPRSPCNSWTQIRISPPSTLVQHF